MDFKQLEDWSVCQKCGRVTARGTMHWLDLPSVKDPWRVVRCPLHWTDRAIRSTALGRSNDGRRRMKMAKRYAKLHPERFSLNPIFEPFPMDDVISLRNMEKFRGKSAHEIHMKKLHAGGKRKRSKNTQEEDE